MGSIMIQWDFIVIQWDIIGLYFLVICYRTIEHGQYSPTCSKDGDFPQLC